MIEYFLTFGFGGFIASLVYKDKIRKLEAKIKEQEVTINSFMLASHC